MLRTDGVVNALRNRIADHQLPPGSKLRESALAEEFGVGRAQIREALAIIEQRGLVERVPNRGAVVVRLDFQELLDLFDVREMLESLAARLATKNVAPESWQDLVELFGEPTARIVEANDFDSYVANLERLSNRLIEAACSRVLSDMLDLIFDKTRVLARRTVILPGRAAQSLEQQRNLLAAMRRGDAEAAERLKRESIRAARDCVVQYREYIL